ncbi:MAG: cupin domain-containing protein [Pseudomonadota bacterium]
MSTWSLERLVDPISSEEFFNSYFESQKLLVRRNRPNYFDELLTLNDVDRIITNQESRYRDIIVTNAASQIEKSDYIYPDKAETVRADQVFRLHHDGATVILNQLQKRHRPLAQLCSALELEFSAGFQTNVYLTPATSQGFNPHLDTHDVIVLQVAGSKRWQIYGTPIPLAVRAHDPVVRQPEPGPVAEEFDLRAGDTLYIPRGLVHEAVSTDETSLHITVGVMASTWFDFLVEAVESLAASDVELRTALPRSFATNGRMPESVRQKFESLAGRLSTADIEPVWRRLTERFIDRRSPHLHRQLDAVTFLQKVGLDSVVGRRPFLTYLIDEGSDTINLRFHHQEMSLPAHVNEALRHALETDRFRVGDLPGNLDDEGKVVLVRRLVREGLLQPLNQD